MKKILSQTKNLNNLFDNAIEWELKAQALYEGFAKLFRDYGQVRGFWQQMAEDEAEHAQILEKTRKAIPARQRQAVVSKKNWENVDRVNTLIARVAKEALETLEDAYDIAHRLEISEVNAVFRLLAINLVPDKNREDMLNHQIDRHLERLYLFGRTISRENREGIRIKKND